jgi:hypothetical protein
LDATAVFINTKSCQAVSLANKDQMRELNDLLVEMSQLCDEMTVKNKLPKHMLS